MTIPLLALLYGPALAIVAVAAAVAARCLCREVNSGGLPANGLLLGSASGDWELATDAGATVVSIAAGSAVFGTVAWFRLRAADGATRAYLSTIRRCSAQDWRRLQVLWRFAHKQMVRDPAKC